MDRSDLRRAEILTTYWDDVALGRAPADPGPQPIDGDVADLIERLQALGDLPELDSARERVWQDVQQHARWKEPDVEISAFSLNGAVSLPLPAPRGRPRSVLPGAPGRRVRPLAPLAQAAIVLLVVASLIASYFSVVRRGEPGSPAPGVATPAADATPTDDWPMYRGNPARTGAMAGPGPDGEPVEIWRFQAQGPSSRSPAIANGVAYLQSGDGHVYALDALTGEERWRANLEANEDTPAIVGDTLYVNDGNGALLALDAASGAERWRFAEPVAAFSTPIVVDGVLYAGSDEGAVYAIDAATGAERWRGAASGPTSRSLAVADGMVYAPTVTSALDAFDAASGERRWTFTADEPDLFTGTPTVANDVVHFVAGADLFALDAATGEERWRAAFEGVPVAVAGDMIFGSGFDGVVYAFSAATGEQVWTFATEDRIQAAPAVVGDTVYVASFDQTVYALDVATGQERWGFGLDGAADYGPSIANGVLYVGTDAGSLYALGSSGMEQMSAPILAADEGTPGAAAQEELTSAGGITAKFLWEVVAPPGEDLTLSPAITVDPEGNLWVIDGIANRFRIFSPDGEEIAQWGEAGSGEGQFDFHRDEFNGIGDIAFRTDGGFYVADSQNYRIQQFDADRAFVRAWGSFGQGEGQFQDAAMLLIDAAGNVYVGDDLRGDWQKFTGEGDYLLTIGEPGSEPGQMDPGWGAFDGEGNLVIPDFGNNRVQRFSPDGEYLGVFGEFGSGDGAVDHAQDAVVDAEGRILVSDSGNNRIAIYDASGAFLQAIDGAEAGGSAFAWPNAIALDDHGNLYVLEYDTPTDAPIRIQKFRLGTAETTEPTALIAPPTFLWQATGGPEPIYGAGAVAFDADGNVWVMDAGNNRFQIFSPEGAFLETWDGTGGGGEPFDFAKNNGGFDGDIAFDAEGNLYVVEAGSKRVQVFAPDRTALASWGGSDDARFTDPHGIAVDSAGNVYVLDLGSNDVQKFDGTGQLLATFDGDGEASFRDAAYLSIDAQDTLWLAAGNRIVALSADGVFLREFGSTGDAPGQFRGAIDVAVDANGIVYVADLDHGWVQVFAADGAPLAVWDAGRTTAGDRNQPYALAPDNQGNLYVVGNAPDGNSDGNVQKFKLPTLS